MLKKNLLMLTLGLMAGVNALAVEGPQYECKVNRWDYSKGVGRECGTVTLSMESSEGNELKDCDVKVYGGSAWASKGRVLHIVLGTDAGALSSKNLKDMTSLAIYPESAPKDFQVSLLPGSFSYRDLSITMDCSAKN